MERSFSDLLQRATIEPGIISAAYSQFHNYSFGNVLLAACQCAERGIPMGPIATFNRWKELGRFVRKGEKAITLCRPVTIKTKRDDGTEDKTIARFIFRNMWFVLGQTDGAELAPVAVADWDKTRALAALNVSEVPFDCPDGNTLGYAIGRTLAINPVNPRPFRTLFHELAHILIGHTAELAQPDTDRTPRDLRECEAEAVAMLVGAALNLPGAEESRGYIQHWYGQGRPIPEASARRILKTADQILKAGRPATADAEAA